ncbi:MAG: glutamine synthetase family protein [Ktedonobacteraceae bacterium]
MGMQEVLQQTRDAQVRLIRFLYCDNGGIIRGKATHAGKLASRMEEGIGQTLAMQAFTSVETLASVDGMGPVGEFRLVPDPDSFVILPYAPHTGSMFCDMMRVDGSPWEACPRTFLKRMSAELAKEGMRAEASVEHEFYLAREQQGSYVPADRSLCYSSIGLAEQAEVIDALLEALEAQGVVPELFHAELGPAQQELSIQHSDVLKAADTVLLVRETARSVARRFNLYATFAPKPFLDQAGSGAHIHFSLWDNRSTGPATNLFYAAGERGGLSQTGRYFIGGVLKHIAALLALTCASPNSYRRLLPHYWSSAFAVYGFDNREAALRIPSLFRGREAQSINVELKSADHSGNPYLAIGGLIAAGLDGIRNHIEPPASIDIDPGNYTDHEREQLGIRRLPATLHDALDALAQDRAMHDALGPLLARSYIEVKREEAAFFAEKSPQEETLQHFYKY